MNRNKGNGGSRMAFPSFLVYHHSYMVMRHCYLLLFFLALPFLALAQTDVLLCIGETDIPKSDFESYWRGLSASDREAGVESCFEQYIFDCLKIADGRSAGWDKQSTFIQWCKAETGARLRTDMLQRLRNDSLLQKAYREKAKRFAATGWAKLNHISILLRQDAGKTAEREAMVRMDSIYNALKGGADFDLLAADSSRWIPLYLLTQEHSSVINDMPVGQYSKPFLSPSGIHILKLDGRMAGNELSDSLRLVDPFLESRVLLAELERSGQLHSWNSDGSEKEDYYNIVYSQTQDSLLVASWNKKNAMPDAVDTDSAELESFFQTNKKRYDWDLPHFKGAVVYCNDKKSASQIKKQLKKRSMDEWADILDAWNSEHPETIAKMEQGLFRIGKNQYVDKLVFKCGELPADASAYTFTLGKRLKNGPENYQDVYNKVRKDFLLDKERSQIDDLKARFGVEINQDVLKTVNCSASN